MSFLFELSRWKSPIYLEREPWMRLRLFIRGHFVERRDIPAAARPKGEGHRSRDGNPGPENRKASGRHGADASQLPEKRSPGKAR